MQVGTRQQVFGFVVWGAGEPSGVERRGIGRINDRRRVYRASVNLPVQLDAERLGDVGDPLDGPSVGLDRRIVAGVLDRLGLVFEVADGLAEVNALLLDRQG